MASYSVRRENAKDYFRSERHPIPQWDGFAIQGPFLVSPDGYGIHKNVCRDIEYTLYLHRLIGYYSDWIPAPSKNPYAIGHFDQRLEWAVDRLVKQLETEGLNS